MTTKTSSGGGGVGFAGLLTLLFITLKLTNYIAWSWWWVLAPLWVPASLLLSTLAVVLITLFIKDLRKASK